jgi:hypothetical protein
MITGCDLAAVDDPLPRRNHCERQRGCLDHREVGRLRSEQSNIDSGEFRQGTLQRTDATGHSVDLVARCKARDPGTDSHDDAGQVDPQNGRRRDLGVRGGSSHPAD